jgi:signal transduction histidine kinase
MAAGMAPLCRLVAPIMQPATVNPPLSSRLASATWGLSQRHWRFVVVAMLVFLHVAAFRGVSDPWARGLLLAHLGLLLLWQPFLRAEQRVSTSQALVLGALAVTVMLALNWWLLTFWVVMLAGLVGGKVYQHHLRWQRRSYQMVLLYLLALLAVVILPEVAPLREIDADIRRYAEILLPLCFVPILLLPAEPEPTDAAQMIDFFYSVFLMLLLGVVILGSFTVMTLQRTGYLEALTRTVFITAGAVLLIGLVWGPRRGFAGLNMFFSRYLFSIGLPLEKWLQMLAELTQLEARPARFLADAVAALMRVPSVSGVAWRTAEERAELGARTPYPVEFDNSALALTIYSRYRMSPALHWHLHLLGQLLGEFYLGKMREEELRQASYLQAVHETGARMTHDIKNLLQSLNVLVGAAARDDGRDSPELQALMRRQLPAMSQRLAETLEKLQRPREVDETYVAAQAWWEAVARQYRGEQVEFAPLGMGGAAGAAARLPRTLFDSVADNLIRNALSKRATDPAVRVRASLECGQRLALRVHDSGRAVAEEVRDTLLRAPVRSGQKGMGIGLYQAARQAESAGFSLVLEANRDGEVCFALSGPAA